MKIKIKAYIVHVQEFDMNYLRRNLDIENYSSKSYLQLIPRIQHLPTTTHTKDQHRTYHRYVRTDPISNSTWMISISHYWFRYRYRVPDKVSVASSATYFLSNSPPTTVDVPLLLHIGILHGRRGRCPTILLCIHCMYVFAFVANPERRAMIYFRKWKRKMLHRSNIGAKGCRTESHVFGVFRLCSILSCESALLLEAYDFFGIQSIDTRKLVVLITIAIVLFALFEKSLRINIEDDWPDH